MRPPSPRRRWLAVGISLVLLAGLAVPLARRVAARSGRPSVPVRETRIPDGAGARLQEAMRRQELIRAERTAGMLWRLQADRPEDGR